MEIKNHWVGDIPRPWFIQVRDQESGLPMPLTGFTTVRAVMRGSDNEEIVFDGDNIGVTSAVLGEIRIIWPPESVFTKPGRYVLQVELVGTGAAYKTTVQEINVKQLGGTR